MRVVLKFLLISVAIVLLIPVAAFGWLYFDTAGLPDWRGLAQFTPDTPKQISDPCLGTNEPVVAYPYDEIGPTMRKALSIAEGGEEYPGIFESLYSSFRRTTAGKRAPAKAILSYAIVKTMFCQHAPGRTVNHHLDSLRLAIQLERHYSRKELFTIFANRIYFADGQYGVADASLHFFRKEPNQLSIEEAALLAGMPRAPGRYSPRLHPDLALARRNEVIDEMAAAHAITMVEATSAKAVPLEFMPISENSTKH